MVYKGCGCQTFYLQPIARQVNAYVYLCHFSCVDVSLTLQRVHP